MRVLITADLHLVRVWRPAVIKVLEGWVREYVPDALLIAGDIAVASEAGAALNELRRVFPHGPVIAALGNHDFWVGADSSCKTLPEVIEKFWSSPGNEYEVTLLDLENFRSEDLEFVGGYGHYDLGFAFPQLRYEGQLVTREHYLQGRPPVQTPLRWRDFDLMPSAEDLLMVASAQVEAIRGKILATESSQIFLALHTPPFWELLGIPSGVHLDPERPPIRAFFRAYLGNNSMGEMLQFYSERICGLACGHTHRPAGPVDLGGFIGVNVGSDYGAPRGFIFDTRDVKAGISPVVDTVPGE